MTDFDTNSVLAAQIDAGTLALQREAFGLLDLVEGTVAQMEPRAHAKFLSLMAFVAPEIPACLTGFPAGLRRALLNLVDNAIKFTEKGEVVVRVSPVGAAGGGKTDEPVVVRFEIGDTGIGLPPATQAFLSPAVRANGRGDVGAPGLGLVVARHLVDRLGGSINVMESGSRGTTLAFEVPFGVASAEPAGGTVQSASAAPVAEAHPDAALPALRALVVDDNQTHREILLRYLSYWGIRSASAGSGEEALDTLTRAATGGDPFDVAILDLAMPGMDGFAVAHAIRREPALAGVRLILLTAFDERGQGEMALREGFAAYLTKPVKHAHLLETLRRTVGESNGRAAE